MKKKLIFISVFAILSMTGILNWRNQDDKKPKQDSQQDFLVFHNSIEKAIEPENEDTKIPEFINNLRESYSFKIKSITKLDSEDNYQGIVMLTYADVSDDIASYIEKKCSTSFDVNKFDSDIAEIISNSELVTEEYEMYFTKNGDEINPAFTGDMIDKMYGGIYSSCYKKLEEFIDKSEGSE